MSNNVMQPLPLTAFGDIRVAEITPLFQGTFEYTVDNTDLTTNTVTGTASITQGTGKAILSTGTTAGSVAYLETKTHGRYRSGMGGLYRFTLQIDAVGTGTKQYGGIADAQGSSADLKNGYVVGYDGTNYGFHRFQNDVKFTTAIAAWDDPLDGSGASGLVIDWTKQNVFAIAYQYLGGGAQYVYYEEPATGNLLLVHTAPYAGLHTVPSVYNPNFHGVLLVDNGAEATDYQISASSYAYFVEGKVKEWQIHQPQNSSGTVELASVTALVPVFTIRVKSTYASKTNFIDVLLERIACSIEASTPNNLGEIRIIKDATLTGEVWNDINTTNSVVEIDTSATALSGGRTIENIPLAGKNDRVIENLVPYDIIGQESESFTVAALSANSATVRASILWKELF